MCSLDSKHLSQCFCVCCKSVNCYEITFTKTPTHVTISRGHIHGIVPTRNTPVPPEAPWIIAGINLQDNSLSLVPCMYQCPQVKESFPVECVCNHYTLECVLSKLTVPDRVPIHILYVSHVILNSWLLIYPERHGLCSKS